jgi:hypothetical protein
VWLVTGSYWEEVVYAASPLDGLERCAAVVVFNWLSLHFPAVGAKIDWSRVRGRHLHSRIPDHAQLTAAASRELLLRIAPGSSVEHVGDGLSPYGVRFSDEIAALAVATLLEIPEHHYFVAEDRSWLIAVTTEGDLDIVDRAEFG